MWILEKKSLKQAPEQTSKNIRVLNAAEFCSRKAVMIYHDLGL